MSDEEYAAARQRDSDAHAAYMEHLRRGDSLLAEMRAALQDVMRLDAHRTDLRELLLDTIRTNVNPRGTTLATLVKRSYRPKEIVVGVLQVLTEAGAIRKDGAGYRVTR